MESSFKGLPPITYPEGKRTEGTLFKVPVVRDPKTKSEFLLKLEKDQAQQAWQSRNVQLIFAYQRRRT